jgi:hypothetical protein
MEPEELVTTLVAALGMRDRLTDPESLLREVPEDLATDVIRAACCRSDHCAKAYGSFSIQGWRRTRMYPDFIFSLSEDGAPAEIVILESKGDFLDNADTAYKNRLLKLCSSAYEFDTTPPKGELELVLDEHNSVRCALVFESNWEARLGEIVG